MLREARHADLIESLDATLLDHAMPAILATIRTTLDYQPAAPVTPR
jgi:hypothetical protein